MSDSDSENDDNRYSSNTKNKKSGGFQSMGLDHNVLKGIIRRGYKIPTPIQRKTIPLILNGKDVCAMARTGSGKTAAFLVPMLQKLKSRCLKAGARALLISPTRELAIQTLKFTKEIGKYTNLKVSLLVGGENMEEQFASIHENPDIIIATPGRLVHVAVEMNLKLTSIEYVVFDEADRLFEMGFEEQLRETMARLPDSRQTLLFSATLPKTLIDFVKAGLNEPVLVRLDVDSKISDKLEMSFLFCRFEDKLAALLHLLRHVIDVDNEQTLIFCATKHHVEYLAELLKKLSFLPGFGVSYLYSSLDPTARKINIERFRKKQSQVLIVTDLAARGVDIPLLDNVINLHFPAKAKLFVHRVGRVARAGRSGRAFSLVSAEEMPYVVDLFLFLGRSLKLIRQDSKISDLKNFESDSVGLFPRSLIEIEDEIIKKAHEGNTDLEFLRQGSANAYKQYVRTRPTPSRESVERVKKENMLHDLLIHPLFGQTNEEVKTEEIRSSILDGLRKYKPKITVFELNTSNKDQCWLAMKAKRKAHNKLMKQPIGKEVEEGCSKLDDEENRLFSSKIGSGEVAIGNSLNAEDASVSSEIQNVFSQIIETKFRQNKTLESIDTKNKAKRANQISKKTTAAEKDAEYFLPYQPKDFRQENELTLQKSAFEREANSAVVDFTTDETADMHKQQQNRLKWDRKRKKFVRDNVNEGKNKKIKTESGVWIPASYKTDLYSKWLKKSKYDHRGGDDEDNDGENENWSSNKNGNSRMKAGNFAGNRRGKFGNNRPFTNDRNAPGSNLKKVTGDPTSKSFTGRFKKGKKPPNRSEIKSKEQILKQRKTKERVQARQSFRREKNAKKFKGGKRKSTR